tara:strand:- start:7587 stop:8333 length:747 start_codon:yes stop_codon:yes gene_type:complete
MKMGKYFSDANEMTNYAGDSEFLGVDGSGGSSAGLGGSTSQPYILSIANSTTDAVASVKVFNAYANLQATNQGNVAAITISMGISGLTYLEMLYQSMNKPFTIGLTYLSSANASQVLETLKISQKDINGNESHKTVAPTIDPYQQQTGKVAIAFNYKIDGFTQVTISSILASATLSMYLYPAENVAAGRALTGGQVVKGFSNPDVVKRDQVQVVSAPAAAPSLGFGGRMSNAGGGRKRPSRRGGRGRY